MYEKCMIHESSRKTFDVIYHRPNKSFIQFLFILRENINAYGISFLCGCFFFIEKYGNIMCDI